LGKAQALGQARQLSDRRPLAGAPLAKRAADRRDNSKVLKNSVQSLAKGFRVLESMISKSGDRFPACAKPWPANFVCMDASAGEARSEEIMLQS
jgi:hypothetical protein